MVYVDVVSKLKFQCRCITNSKMVTDAQCFMSLAADSYRPKNMSFIEAVILRVLGGWGKADIVYAKSAEALLLKQAGMRRWRSRKLWVPWIPPHLLFPHFSLPTTFLYHSRMKGLQYVK